MPAPPAMSRTPPKAPAPASAPTQTAVCFRCHDTPARGRPRRSRPSTRTRRARRNVRPPAPTTVTTRWPPDTGHTLASNDEFGGRRNRHSQCADCHQPHTATSRRGAMTTAGWTAPGQLDGISAVAVANGAPARRRPTRSSTAGRSGDPRVPALLQVPLRSDRPALQRGFTPSMSLLDKASSSIRPTRRTTRSRHPARTRRRRWPPAWPGPRRTSCGTSPRRARSAA